MIGNMTVYTAMAEPGDVIMTAAQPVGGHSSNRPDGPAGVRGRVMAPLQWLEIYPLK
jgi:glycine hydroxymethyltransferase